MALMLNLAAVLLLDDDDELEQDGPIVWQLINVDIDEFMSNEAFKLHFRMGRELFEDLVVLMTPLLDSDDAQHTDPNYDLAHFLLMVLWILATPDTFRNVALRFGKTPGVIHYHYQTVISALCSISEVFIVWPIPAERAIISRAVKRRTGFPGVVGSTDGTHIVVATPREEARRYFNRKQGYSIVLQAVADEGMLFRDIYVGEPGSIHEPRVFRRSPLCAAILESPEDYFSDGEHILGDGAYIRTDRNKWRRLYYLTAVNLEYAVQTVVACCVLHNFILLDGEVPPPMAPDAIFGDNAAVELMEDDGVPLEFDHPNVPLEQDHPLLAEARLLGIGK